MSNNPTPQPEDSDTKLSELRELIDIVEYPHKYLTPEQKKLPYLKRQLVAKFIQVSSIDRHTLLAEKRAQKGLLEYFDQIPSNDVMDWKGLIDDNLKIVTAELKKLEGDSHE